MLLASYCLLRTTHYVLRTTYYALRTTCYLLLTTYCSLLTAHYLLLTTHYSAHLSHREAHVLQRKRPCSHQSRAALPAQVLQGLHRNFAFKSCHGNCHGRGWEGTGCAGIGCAWWGGRSRARVASRSTCLGRVFAAVELSPDPLNPPTGEKKHTQL